MLRLRINTDGDAFAHGNGPSEVAYLLRLLANRVATGNEFDGFIRDSNGNTCGQWDLRFDRSQAREEE